jgi:hypothetical protein
MTARRRPAPALRFLLLVVGGWICLRAAMLAPAWWDAEPDATPIPPIAAPRPGAGADTPAPAQSIAAGSVRQPEFLIRQLSYKTDGYLPALPVRYDAVDRVAGSGDRGVAAELPSPQPAPALQAPRQQGVEAGAILDPSLAARLPPRPAAAPGRWAGSAWLLVRDERGRGGLAPAGTLGGSQAGGRLLFRLNEGLALSGRAYLPLRRASEAELAAGIEWHPVAALPVNLLVERRQAVGGGGRSAFAVTVHGGASRALGRGVRLDLYGQAGLVGTRPPDAFVDGSARLSATLGPIEAGAGLWGGAQPGAARLDAGPSLAWRLPVRGANLRLQADWRLRLAGEAAPGSGPALTLAADF